MAREHSLSSIEDSKSTDSVVDQPHEDDSLVSKTEPESSDKGSKSIEQKKSKDDSPILENAKKMVRMQSAVENYSEMELSVKPAGILKPSPSLWMNLDSIYTSVSPGRMSSDNVFVMMDETWEKLKSYVYFKGSPIGTLATLDPSAKDLNYN